MGLAQAWLAFSICCEVVATSLLKVASLQRPGALALVIVCYTTAFFGLSQSLKQIPVGMAYAVWSGVGTALITIIGWAVYRQTLSPMVIAGLVLIVLGVAIVNLAGTSQG